MSNKEYSVCAVKMAIFLTNECKPGIVDKESCPLVEVLDHGDLIDRDEMAHEIWSAHCYECKSGGEQSDGIEIHCESCVIKDILDSIVDFPEYKEAE